MAGGMGVRAWIDNHEIDDLPKFKWRTPACRGSHRLIKTPALREIFPLLTPFLLGVGHFVRLLLKRTQLASLNNFKLFTWHEHLITTFRERFESIAKRERIFVGLISNRHSKRAAMGHLVYDGLQNVPTNPPSNALSAIVMPIHNWIVLPILKDCRLAWSIGKLDHAL